jgi:hypothetical protein
LDGTVHIVYREREVLFTEIKELPRKPAVTQQKQQNPEPKSEVHTSSGSSLEKIQPPDSTHQPGITGVRSPEDISNELK